MALSHIPYLSEDEKIFLNITATCSQARRTSSVEQTRSSMESSKRCPSMQSHTRSFFWKRRTSSQSSLGSLDCAMESEENIRRPSPKAKTLEMLIFGQPQRTVRLSLTPRCAA
ncbi:hypothetical protein BY458DRAFT_506479 [Sporodiniella umbellata]|nr:hypothetical protein BY458DRAFT_506479 [Sporodiniella umbellata]